MCISIRIHIYNIRTESLYTLKFVDNANKLKIRPNHNNMRPKTQSARLWNKPTCYIYLYITTNPNLSNHKYKNRPYKFITSSSFPCPPPIHFHITLNITATIFIIIDIYHPNCCCTSHANVSCVDMLPTLSPIQPSTSNPIDTAGLTWLRNRRGRLATAIC